MINYMKTMVYVGLQDIENNGLSDWLKKKEHAIGWMVARLLAPQAR